MNDIRIFEVRNDEDKSNVLGLSKLWENENITYGYTACTKEIFDSNRVWIIHEDYFAIGFLYGKQEKSEGMSVIPKDASYFVIDDFYLVPNYRNKGIGTIFFEYVEQQLKNEGIEYVLLSTATKNHEKITRFYTEKVGLTVWTTTLFKKL